MCGQRNWPNSSSLKQLAQDITQPWRDAVVTWYGGETKQVRVLSGTNLWYSPGEKPLLIRWVLVYDPDKNQAEAFFSTDIGLAPEQIVNYFVLRWNIEVTRCSCSGSIAGYFKELDMTMFLGAQIAA